MRAEKKLPDRVINKQYTGYKEAVLKAVILAAGAGTRIGNQLPKCLMELPSGKTIIGNQIDILKENGIREIVVVVGFKKDIIMEKYSDVVYKYNPFYHMTNTSKSLMMALQSIDVGDTLWLNGDVFLESAVIDIVLSEKGNVIAVNKAKCDDEEVKYKTGGDGRIVEISKSIEHAEGESVGVNKIIAESFNPFMESLSQCKDSDYFERGIEICISKGMDFFPVDISKCKCIEIDFQEDFEKVKEFFE